MSQLQQLIRAARDSDTKKKGGGSPQPFSSLFVPQKIKTPPADEAAEAAAAAQVL